MLELKNIKKDYVSGDLVVHALKGISISLRDHEFVSILGPSGCGKTTTLNIIGGLDRYTDGDLLIEGTSTKEFKDSNWDQYRNHKVGFVFQSYNLIPHQTVLSNVELALTIGGISKDKREELAKEALIKVGLEDEIKKFPRQLSGGQMQRVAIARALVNKPQVLLADEPTGALDSKTSVQVLELLKELSSECLVVMVTHNEELANKYSTRIVTLKDGEMVSDSNPYDPTVEEKEASLKKEKENNSQFLNKKGKMKKVGMPFFTAFKLSLSNLKSKIGRTILTCFAGSIGIIGIALILSVSSGFNNYIDDIETSTLSQYPIEISTQELDITTLFASFLSASNNSDSTNAKKDVVTPNYIMVQLLESMANSTRTNDLKTFKAYIDEHYKELEPYISHIKYEYGISIYAYDAKRIDKNGNFDVRMVEPFTLPDNEEGKEPYYVYASSYGKSTLESFMRNLTIWSEMYSNNDGLMSDTIKSQYDLLAGSWPTSSDEVLYVVDPNNQVSDFIIYATGLTKDEEGYDLGDEYILQLFHYVNGDYVLDDDGNPVLDENGNKIKYQNPKDDPKYASVFEWTYEEIMNKVEFYVIPHSSYYYEDEYADFEKEEEGFIQTYTSAWGNDEKIEELINDGKAIKVKVSGVVMENPNSDAHSISGTIAYTQALIDKIIDMNNNSDVVKYQLAHPEYSLSDISSLSAFPVNTKGVTYEEIYETLKNLAKQSSAISESTAELARPEILYASNMRAYGYRDLSDPSSIKIYPKSFEDKDKVGEFITAYNATKETDEEKISYTDYVKTLMGSVTTIVNSVTYVLIAFVSISLIVSSIMIAIITYISVIERTKEIGILRAMGASKGDVKNIFNAETFITGLISGILGIVVTIILNIPISLIIEHLSGIKNIAVLPWQGGIALVVISFLLSVISGLIPSSFAAKCDPVVALRTE
ncbi:MAG: ABC transporter ATP-binding protein/permease [Gammaproteobacteria bacterium]|nr:ABC transporter ATP-binding protein/permease [Gammaproteobacteria bacterium]